MMEKTVYFRVGSDKAGTVALATFIYKNKQELGKMGVYAPFENAIGLIDYIVKTKGLQHIDIFDAKRRFGDRPDEKAVLQHFLENQTWKTHRALFLSTEVIWGRLSRQQLTDPQIRADAEVLFSEINKLFAGYKIKIILHLRRADRYLESLWNQHVKAGGKLDFDRFFDNFLRRNLPINSKILLDMLETAFGRANLILKPFERDRLWNGDVVLDTLRAMEMEVSSAPFVTSRSNESLNRAMLKVLESMNKSRGKIIKNSGLIKLSGFVSRNLDIEDNGFFLDLARRQQVLNAFSEFYSYISDTYLQGAPVFRDPIPEDGAERYVLSAQNEALIRRLLLACAKHGTSLPVMQSVLERSPELRTASR